MATTVTPSAPPARSYTACTPAQWDAWYCAVQGLDTNMDLLSTIGQELRSHKVDFAEHWVAEYLVLRMVHSAPSVGDARYPTLGVTPLGVTTFAALAPV